MNCSHGQIPLNKSLFNRPDSSLGRHLNAASLKNVIIIIILLLIKNTYYSRAGP